MASYFPVNLMLTVATETISCIRNAHKNGENINPQKALAMCINRRACDYVINQVRIHREASLTVGDCWWARCHRVIFDHHRNCEIGDHTVILVTAAIWLNMSWTSRVYRQGGKDACIIDAIAATALKGSTTVWEQANWAIFKATEWYKPHTHLCTWNESWQVASVYSCEHVHMHGGGVLCGRVRTYACGQVSKSCGPLIHLLLSLYGPTSL